MLARPRAATRAPVHGSSSRHSRAVALVVGLALHVAEVGLIGLAVIVLVTAFNGVTNEHAIGKAFREAMPFTALLVIFFAIVAVIHEQGLFTPVIDAALAQEGQGSSR